MCFSNQSLLHAARHQKHHDRNGFEWNVTTVQMQKTVSDFNVAESLSTLRSAATVLLHSCTHINSDSWCVFVNQMPVLQIRHDVQTKCKRKHTQIDYKNDEIDIKWH